MRDISDFIGGFGDFETLFHDTDLGQYIIRFYDEDGDAYYKAIVGYTNLANDILLHLVDADDIGEFEDIADSAEDYGIQFRLLSKIIGEDGFDIIPYDQYDDEDDLCDLCGEDVFDCTCDDDDDEDGCDCDNCDCDCPLCTMMKDVFSDDDDDDDDENKDISELNKTLTEISKMINSENDSEMATIMGMAGLATIIEAMFGEALKESLKH